MPFALIGGGGGQTLVPHVEVHVHGHVMTEHQLVDVVTNGLVRNQRTRLTPPASSGRLPRTIDAESRLAYDFGPLPVREGGRRRERAEPR